MTDLPLEFYHIPIGRWMAKYQIDNEEILKQVEEKYLNGFSIEAVMAFKKIPLVKPVHNIVPARLNKNL